MRISDDDLAPLLRMYIWNLHEGPSLRVFATEEEEARRFIRNAVLYTKWYGQLAGPADEIYKPHINAVTPYWMGIYRRQRLSFAIAYNPCTQAN